MAPLWLGLVALLAAACGGGISTDLEGIYTIDTWTSNTSSCETEGASVLAAQSEQWFYVRAESYFGSDFVDVELCATDADCAAEAEAGGIAFVGWVYEDGSDGAGWRGANAAVTNSGGECTGTVSDDTLVARSDGTVRIESRFREPRPFAAAGDGTCVSDDALAAADGEPCIRYEAVTATLSGPLP